MLVLVMRAVLWLLGFGESPDCNIAVCFNNIPGDLEVTLTLGLIGNMLIFQAHVQMKFYIGSVWRGVVPGTVPWGAQVPCGYGEKCWTLYRE